MRQIKELIFYAQVFYRFAGWRVPMLVALALISGLLDVIGIVWSTFISCIAKCTSFFFFLATLLNGRGRAIVTRTLYGSAHTI